MLLSSLLAFQPMLANAQSVSLDIGYSDVLGGIVEKKDTGLLFVSASSHW
jgi:hypothetical protein